MTARRGPHAVEDTEQSLGGEDFSWYLEQVPGALARLGVRGPASDTAKRDLHQGDFDADEGAITVGVELFTAAALLDWTPGEAWTASRPGGSTSAEMRRSDNRPSYGLYLTSTRVKLPLSQRRTGRFEPKGTLLRRVSKIAAAGVAPRLSR